VEVTASVFRVKGNTKQATSEKKATNSGLLSITDIAGK
jgi:hypothetical protein